MKPSTLVRVDDRIGSKHLALPLAQHNLRVKLKRLDYGDVWFEGWLKRDIVKIGVELKNIQDLIGSMKSRRLVDRQLPGMAETFQVRYLLVEGVWRPDKHGRVEILKWGRWQPQGVTYSQINRFLTTMSMFGGVTVLRTGDHNETVHSLADLFHWWQKPWRKHRAHLGFFKLPLFDANALRPDSVRRRLRRVAEEFPHLGWYRGIDVADHFKSIKSMVNAPKREWLKIPRFGNKMASDIIAAIEAEQ